MSLLFCVFVIICTLCAYVTMGEIVGGYDLNPQASLKKNAEETTNKFTGDGQIGGSEKENKKLSSAERAAILASQPQHFPDVPGVIMPGSGSEECNPSYACNGINIKEVPYIFEHVDSNFVNQKRNNLFDQKKTTTCLAGKRLLILGDSVLEELMLDLATLMSGVAATKVELDSFVHDSGAKSPHHFLHKLPNGVTVYHHTSRRNMTVISDQSDIYMRHRFVGHYNIKENFYGMKTLNYPPFVNDELLCLLGLVGADNECPQPDIILLNGGHHDVQSGTGSCDSACQQVFADNLRQFLIFVRTQYKRIGHMTIRVFWKGTLLTAKDLMYGFKKNKGALFLLDKQAQIITKEFGIPYINASDVIQYIPRFQEEGKGYSIYTKDRIHHGSIARAHDAMKVGTVSMLITQRTLAAMCPNLGGGPSSPPMPRASVPAGGGVSADISTGSSSDSSSSSSKSSSDINPSPTYDSSHGVPKGTSFGSSSDTTSNTFSFKDSSGSSSSGIGNTDKNENSMSSPSAFNSNNDGKNTNDSNSESKKGGFSQSSSGSGNSQGSSGFGNSQSSSGFGNSQGSSGFGNSQGSSGFGSGNNFGSMKSSNFNNNDNNKSNGSNNFGSQGSSSGNFGADSTGNSIQNNDSGSGSNSNGYGGSSTFGSSNSGSSNGFSSGSNFGSSNYMQQQQQQQGGYATASMTERNSNDNSNQVQGGGYQFNTNMGGGMYGNNGGYNGMMQQQGQMYGQGG